MMTVEEIAAVSKKLTAAQRAYLTHKAEWRKPIFWAAERWMTFPPANVHRVLRRLGLVDGVCQIQALGIAVRDHLAGVSATEGDG